MEKKPSRKRTPLRRAPEDSGSAAKDSHGPSKVDPIHVEGGPLSNDAGDSDSDVIVEFHENVMSSDFGSHLSVPGFRWDLHGIYYRRPCCHGTLAYLSIKVANVIPMSMICFTVVPLAALAVLNSSKFAQPPRPAAQRWLQRLGPTNGGVAMFVALFGGNMKPLSSEMFRMISSLSTLEKPHFSVFLPKPTALSHEFGFYLFEFHLDPMFPVTARCKKNQCPP